MNGSAAEGILARYREKLLPMVVSVPLLLQNIDTSIMGPALPAMASSLHVSPLRLNVAITAYLISLAIFLPTSGWLADRFGSLRTMLVNAMQMTLAYVLRAPPLRRDLPSDQEESRSKIRVNPGCRTALRI